jgi:hypothetical protein
LKILSKLSVPPSGGALKPTAHFDAQIIEGLQLRDLRLIEAPDGNFLVYPPTKGAQVHHGIRNQTSRPCCGGASGRPGAYDRDSI